MEFGNQEAVKEDFADDFVRDVREAVHMARCVRYQASGLKTCCLTINSILIVELKAEESSRHVTTAAEKFKL